MDGLIRCCSKGQWLLGLMISWGLIFKAQKELGRGTPYPPLFNFVADCRTRMVLRAQENDLVIGLIKHMIHKGIAVLQYANDTILCLDHNIEGARNMKLLLYLFQQMAGLKINFDKSEVFMIGGDDEIILEYVDIFNCGINEFPLKYLGVPISAGRLCVADWFKLEKNLQKGLMFGKEVVCHMVAEWS